MRYHDCCNLRSVMKQTKARESTQDRMQAWKHGVGVFGRLERRFGCIEHERNYLPSLLVAVACSPAVASLGPLPFVDMQPCSTLLASPLLEESFVGEAWNRLLA